MTEVLATVRDTVIPETMEIDDSYEGVLAYRDGPWRWFPTQAERFHAAGKLIYPLSVKGADPHLAQVIDCENGDLTDAQAAAWARERNELHGDATVYRSLSNISSLFGALNGESCWLWIAWWTGKPQIPEILTLPPNVKIAAVQYENLPRWDLSAIVSREWPAHPFADMKIW